MGRFTAIEKELKAAKARIGDTEGEVLTWLIDRFKYPCKPFCSDDGTDMSSTDIDLLGYEVVAFLINDWGKESYRFGMVSSSRRIYKVQKVQERQQVFPNIPDRNELARFQEEVESLFERFVADKVVPQSFDKMTLHLVRLEKQPPLLLFEGEPKTELMLKVFLF